MRYEYKCLSVQKFEIDDYQCVPVNPTFIENIRIWRNSQQNVLRQNTKITKEQQKFYYKNNIYPDMKASNPKNILLGYLKKNKLIGYGGIVHISWEMNHGEVSFLLDPTRSNDEMMYLQDFSAFLVLAKNIAFSNLGLTSLFTETYSFRNHHVSILEKSGFILEKTIKKNIKTDHGIYDSLIHGIYNEY